MENPIHFSVIHCSDELQLFPTLDQRSKCAKPFSYCSSPPSRRSAQFSLSSSRQFSQVEHILFWWRWLLALHEHQLPKAPTILKKKGSPLSSSKHRPPIQSVCQSSDSVFTYHHVRFHLRYTRPARSSLSTTTTTTATAKRLTTKRILLHPTDTRIPVS